MAEAGAPTRHWSGLPAQPTRAAEVAVIGMAGRFPGARDVDGFWQLLTAGRAAAAGYAVPADVDLFDASFFGFTPEYARILDPQQRLFLEDSWHALEDAGHDPRRFDGLIGVFAGSDAGTYMSANVLAHPGVLAGLDQQELDLAGDKDALASRVSYLLDLRGPCYSVQSYGSTSLVAVCTAATSLALGECDMALAGGVSIKVSQAAGANGEPAGGGLGMVVLRRLADALADGDHVRAVLKGWAVNNDGGMKASYTAPGRRGQSAVVAAAIAAADLDPPAIDYVETHGTRTAPGGSVEIAALHRVFTAGSRCAIGSAKTNLGDLSHASGIAGLIKTVMSLEHGVIPPTASSSPPERQLPEGDSLTAVTEMTPWPDRGHPRRAGVSSFGIGGTNAHVVLEQAGAPAPRPESLRTRHLLVWSARTDAALADLTGSLRDSLAADGGADLGDVALTLQTGRAAFEHRSCAVSGSRAEAAAALASRADGGVLSARPPAAVRPVGLLIAGVGEQYPGLAGRLYATEPSFRDRLEAGRAALWSLTGRDPLAEFIGERRAPGADDASGFRALAGRAEAAEDGATSVLAQADVIQPVLFTIWYALAETLREWGIRPAVILGYSLGEYVAACLAGVLSFDDALRLVTYRAALISRMPAGAMAAVALGEAATRAAIEQAALPIDIAGANAPLITVIAGPATAVGVFREVLSGRGVACRPLDTSHGFHSRLLDGAADDLTAWIRGHVVLNAPRIPYLSNITGRFITAQEATDPGYWARHMCATVRFSDAVATMLGRDDLALLEIGPGPSLGTMVRAHPGCGRSRWGSIVATLPSAADPRPADAVLAEAIGRLWLAGVPVDFPAYQCGHGRRRVGLPRYPFERERHWLDASGQREAAGTAAARGRVVFERAQVRAGQGRES